MDAATYIARFDALEPRVDLGLNTPATPEALDTLQSIVGVPLPASFRSMYLAHDGQADPAAGAFLNLSWLSLDGVRFNVQGWQETLDSVGDSTDGSQVSEPTDAIAEVYWHPHWIPFAHDGGGNFLAVDLAPGPKGTAGQVINAGRDEDVSYVLATSLEEFFDRVWVHFEQGTAVITEASDDDGPTCLQLQEPGSLLDNLPLFLKPFRAADESAPEVDDAWVRSLHPEWQRYIDKQGSNRFVSADFFNSQEYDFPSYEPLAVCTNLKELMIYDRQPLESLTSLPPLPRLRELNVTTKSLEGIGRFPELTALVLPSGVANVDLRSLPEAPKLKELRLIDRHDDISVLPQCKSLRTLVCTPVDAQQWEAVGKCASLRDLEAECAVASPPADTFEALKNLTAVTLGDCDGADVSGFAKCSKLKEIDFAGNDLKGVESLRVLKKVQYATISFDAWQILQPHWADVSFSMAAAASFQEKQAFLRYQRARR